MKKIITFLLLLISIHSFSQSTTVVISQVYGGGGATTGATYNFDYVELHNVSGVNQLLTGFSIQYGSSTGNFGNTASQIYAFPAGTSIPAGGYLLIQCGSAGAAGTAFPVTPDLITANLAMSAASGKVALANQATGLGCGATATSCTLPHAAIIDLVSFGASNNAEGGVSVNNGIALNNTQGSVRKTLGCTDTDNNNLDFDVITVPIPRNAGSTVNLCGPPSPILTSTTLTAFGNVCLNTTAGPNSFTITGTTLNASDVTVAALAGYNYATSVGGPYTASLSLTQPGGAYSQQIFVRFTPTLVQSYNGNIVVAGGGAPSINVAAAGAGVNTAPSVTTGAASAITISSATLAGSIPSIGCSAITAAYGIEYSIINGFVNGTGTQVVSTNLSGANFSSNVTGLAASTVYYYKAYATNAGGITYGTQLSFTTSAPSSSLSASAISAFGNVCINTTAGPNSFTITGTGLTTANVTVAALTGFEYAITSGGPYTASLSLTQPGGAYSQQIFVRFTPTLVQSYNGNIVVGGGGATNVNVAASGAGVNTAASVTTGSASAITSSSATLAGSIPSIGCSAITAAYGIEYSTTNGFVNGTGTQVVSTNLSGANFSSNVTGLAVSTTYYYKAYATNAGGITYGTQMSFTTAGPSASLSASALSAFGNVCINTTTGPNSFTITGTALTAANINVAALTGFEYATSSGGPYTTSLSLTQPGGAYSQQIFVRFTPTLVQSYNGNINVAGGGAPSINVAATGAGINSLASVTTGSASAITTSSATLAGGISANGCSAITNYGIEYSLINGFVNGTGTQEPSTNLSAGVFSSNVTGLASNTTYYYKAYATNLAGTAYGVQMSFITQALTPTLNATTLAGFGNVCVNTIAGPNSFTITGSALSAADVTVGALSGFSYSTIAGGTYTPSLTLSQPGGTFNQIIYVRFNPLLVQSYNGNIVVGGAGASSINVAATGAGENSMATVTTGASSAITSISATLAGTIPANGCSAISVYGIEYSTTNGFVNGTGTQVASSNLSGINFTSSVTGLLPTTTYYYKAYATNAGGTAYGSQMQFTTATPVLSAGTLTGFGNVCLNIVAGPNSFTITGTNLTTANVNVGPLAAFSFSTSAAGTYTPSLSLTQGSGAYSQQIFVRFTPTLVQSYNGNIPVSGAGASSINVAATGAGVNTMATVTTGASSAITSISATLAGTIPAIGCSAISGYGIEYSTTNGFVNGTGTQVASSNLSGINFTSSVTGLLPTTTYYYKAYATNAGGTAYGSQMQFTTATPVLSAGTLTGFGNVCLNVVAGPNSFTITGTNLTTTNVNVGPLAAFSFSTSAAGTYTPSLSLTQGSGTYSQQVFVRFTPTLVQSYNGNIPVSGAGATSINVAATGAGVNTMATVTSGTASAITQITATVAGTIPTIGCSAVTGYGIEFSTINGFVNGTGTQVTSTNLSGVIFSSALTGLLPSTTYYFKAFATNNGGTAYGNQGSFTTLAPVLTVTPLTAFGAVCINTNAGPNTFTINSNAVTVANINVAALTGYSFATSTAGPYTTTLSLVHPAGAFAQTIFVRFTPTAVLLYNGNIVVSGGGAPLVVNVAASGSGINTPATMVTGFASTLQLNAVLMNGSISSIGCSPITSYGFEYSGISGLANGLGKQVFSTNLNAGVFSAFTNGLVQGAKYYYRAFAINNGGIAYGPELSFTTLGINNGFVIYDNPIQRCSNLHYTYKGIKPGHYEIQIFNSNGQLVFQREHITPVNFIDDNFILPCQLSPGVYSLHIVNPFFRDKKSFMIR